MSSTAGITGQKALAWAKLKMELLKLFHCGDKAAGTTDPEQTLDETSRAEMERLLGYDLRDVRIHMTKQAGELARQLDAEAFTIGSDIFAAEGKLNPETSEGRGLLIHELTHMIQQTHPQPVNHHAGQREQQEWQLYSAQGLSSAAEHIEMPHVPPTQFAPITPSSDGDSTREAAMEAEAVRAEQAMRLTKDKTNKEQTVVIDTNELALRVYHLMQRELLLEKDRTRR